MSSDKGSPEKGGKGDYGGGAIDPNKLGFKPPERAEQGPPDLFNKPPKSWPELVGAFCVLRLCGPIVWCGIVWLVGWWWVNAWVILWGSRMRTYSPHPPIIRTRRRLTRLSFVFPSIPGIQSVHERAHTHTHT
jgi:hypothetical protein